jgi:hypothetical protein
MSEETAFSSIPDPGAEMCLYQERPMSRACRPAASLLHLQGVRLTLELSNERVAVLRRYVQ